MACVGSRRVHTQQQATTLSPVEGGRNDGCKRTDQWWRAGPPRPTGTNGSALTRSGRYDTTFWLAPIGQRYMPSRPRSSIERSMRHQISNFTGSSSIKQPDSRGDPPLTRASSACPAAVDPRGRNGQYRTRRLRLPTSLYQHGGRPFQTVPERTHGVQSLGGGVPM